MQLARRRTDCGREHRHRLAGLGGHRRVQSLAERGNLIRRTSPAGSPRRCT
ncbi:MAG: hypothetical protein HRU01_26220 [Myxococcales bacterium]|nr:hypothetical protein [Myxococcales bacterium]